MSQPLISMPLQFGSINTLSCGCRVTLLEYELTGNRIKCLISTACGDHNAERVIIAQIVSDRERLALICAYDPSDNNGKGSAVLEVPKKPNRAGCVVFNRAGEVLLVKGMASKAECYYFPKGHIDLVKGVPELPVDAALREVHEETGVTLDYTTIPFLCYYSYEYRKEMIKVAYFSAQAVVKDAKGDHDSFFCPVSKAKEIIHPGLIPVLEVALGEVVAEAEIEESRTPLKS